MRTDDAGFFQLWSYSIYSLFGKNLLKFDLIIRTSIIETHYLPYWGLSIMLFTCFVARYVCLLEHQAYQLFTLLTGYLSFYVNLELYHILP